MSFSPLPGRPFSRGALRGLSWLLFAALAGASAPAADPPTLVDGLILEREIRGGESQSYPVSLEEGQFLRVVVEQRGIDLVARLLDARGDVLLRIDGLNAKGREDLAYLADCSGRFQVEIFSEKPGVPPGRYGLRVEGPRQPTGLDSPRARAARLLSAVIDEFSPREGALQRRAGHLEELLPVWRSLGESWREAETRFWLGQALYDLREWEMAAKHSYQAGVLWTEESDRFLRASAWRGAGIAEKELSRPAIALAHFEEALAITRQIGDLRLQANLLHLAGNLQVEEGDLVDGIEHLREALRISREIGDRPRERRLLNDLGSAHMDLSEPQEALRLYQDALFLGEPRDRVIEAAILNNLGDVYATLGEYEKARDHFGLALAINQELGDGSKEATVFNNLGFAFLGLEEPGAALTSFNQAMALARQRKDRYLEAIALVNRSILHLQQSRPQEARDDAEQALALNPEGMAEIDSRLMLGAALRKLGDLPGARRELERGLTLSREREASDRKAAITLTLARLDRDEGRPLDALERTRTAIEIVESLRTRVVSQDLRASFLASKQDYYEFQIDTLMALHESRPEAGFATDALQVSESARARSLLEILTAAKADIAERERYASLTRPRLLNVLEIQSQVLDGEAVLLEYALGKERSYLWVVTPEVIHGFPLPPRQVVEEAARGYYAALTARNAKVDGESVPDRRRRIQQADAEATQAAAALSRLILEKAEPLLGTRPLLVVADGALQYIPFSALPIPSTGEPLASRNKVVNLPSASALAVLRGELEGRAAAPKIVAVLADPVFQSTDERFSGGSRSLGTETLTPATRESPVDVSRLRRLPSSAKEANAILGLVPEEQSFRALGFEASRATATSGKLADYRKVHFATHGFLDSRRPEQSALVLSLYDPKGKPQEGLLSLHDIYNLRLNADLVVLSACQTALGKDIRGEGLVGLTRGFMYAGAARVLASLWSVEDRATAKLMTSFYRNMLQEKVPPAEALRRAQVELSRDPNWKSPYFWAGFSLQGEWR